MPRLVHDRCRRLGFVSQSAPWLMVTIVGRQPGMKSLMRRVADSSSPVDSPLARYDRRMVDAVLFDLDGTLITYGRNYAAFMQSIAKLWQITDHEDPFFAAYSQAILEEGPVTFASAIEKALQASGRTLQSCADEFCRKAVADYADGTDLLPWALDLLGQFDRLPKAIVTNGPFDMQLAAILKSKLEQRVDEIVVSGDPNVGVRKPNPAIFNLACKRLNVDPARVLMIGDNETVDILGAREAGLQAILVTDLIDGNRKPWPDFSE